ncbi:PC-esterase domain-containing protein 1B [Caerostris darwini]|uniref:PC-esterase domain-containing protein 1B n=1 Tax=Caerostris darwini TaxID=1538125 RepID=A0AAV4X761_9ARAC|nr:PC-esterase domain-containing protein 1B [Caerostris darwini]
MRALYNDFICLWHNSKYIPNRILQNKQESTVFDDKLVSRSLETNGRYYREEREARLGDLQVKFFYLTKVYSEYVEYILTKVCKSSYPYIIIMNSCLWDLLRWGHDGVEDYKFNLYYLFRKLKRVIPGCLIIWITTPPVGNEMIVSLVEELNFLKHSLHVHILEANDHAKQVVIKNGFNVLDIHNHWQMKVHQRTDDGMRWKPEAILFVTNLLLARISLSYNFPLPHRYESSSMEEEQKLGSEYYEKDADIEPERREIVNFQTLFSIFPNSVLNENSGKRENLWRHYRGETVHSFMTRERKKVRRRHRRQWQQHISRDYSQPPVDSFVPNFGCNSLARNVYYYTLK